MSVPLPRRALHLVSASGGGMTRFSRDLVAHGQGHALLHAAADTWVVESGCGAGVRYSPYRLPSADEAADWLDALLASHDCDLLHAHYLGPCTLPVLEAWCGNGRPWIASLHDVGFLRADAFAAADGLPQVDPVWSERWRRVLATASAITAPSEFLAGTFAAACSGLHAKIVAPGVGECAAAPRRHPDTAVRARPLRSIAIVGALGAHKGKQRLLEWLAHPDAAHLRWTLIGYTEDQLHPGWLADGRLRVHGPFLPERTADWLRHYDVDLVLFPNRLAESFSYALSDVWAAGIPALVADVGALAERVQRFGGGGLLRSPDDPVAVHAELRRHVSDGGAKLARWRTEIASRRHVMVPTLTSMVESMRPIYDQMPRATVTVTAAIDDLQPYLRTQLDDLVFRHENIRLARDYALVRTWADKLSRDVNRLEDDLRAVSRVRVELDRQVGEREDAIAALRMRNDCVERDAAALFERNHTVEADAAALSCAVAELTQRDATQAAAIAELSAHREHLNEQLGAHAERCSLLAETCDAQAGELALMRQRINALEMELQPLRVKGARHDRVLAWLPSSLLALLRSWRDSRNHRRLARSER